MAQSTKGGGVTIQHCRAINKQWLIWTVCLCVLLSGRIALAQTVDPADAAQLNPLLVLEEAAETLPGAEDGLSGPLNILLLLTVLSLAPAILILCTCFTRIVIVLGLLRQALGTQGLPPGQVIVGLSMFLTFVIGILCLHRSRPPGTGPACT